MLTKNDRKIAKEEGVRYRCSCDVKGELKKYNRPMHMAAKPSYGAMMSLIREYSGPELNLSHWGAEAPLRMLLNNLHPKVALNWEELIVYGGAGRAVRNWHEFHKIIRALEELKKDETLCIQSGKPVYIAKTHPDAPRVILANSNLVPACADMATFDELDRLGLIMYGQMTAGSWIYIGTQGILQGTYETFGALARAEFDKDDLRGKFVLTAGMGAMSGAQPLAVTMNGGVILDVEVRPERIKQKVKEGYCDRMTWKLDEALKWIDEAKKKKVPLSIGLVGNAAEIHPELVRRGIIPDIVTDQTPAHDPNSYIPIESHLKELKKIENDLERWGEHRDRAMDSMGLHLAAMLEMKKQGAIVFDYGNNLRGWVLYGLIQAVHCGEGGRDSYAEGAIDYGNKCYPNLQKLQHLQKEIVNEEGEYVCYPGFVKAYIRPLFCQGKGPFRWATLSGDPQDILEIDKAIFSTFKGEEYESLHRWIKKAQKKVPFIGLPTRICWLSYGDRAKFGNVINHLVKIGKVKAPVVIGRDHLDCGSVASPSRETEGMKDYSDAIADWPLINFALNTANGASWVSFHHGGGVGIGNSLHAGMVIVADGTRKQAKKLERVLTVDPGIGIARHADAGYKLALRTARRKGVKIPK